ncbi:MAG: LacI family DNA-binding transcriptional regulator [Bacteroidales bacterium]|nr:LacI family DNA-binding transcriptional regulator [Bacteroidales bacterium]
MNNLQSIAAETGYSVSTVSRVLTGQAEKFRISKKAIELITETARKCNYQPDLVAQTLRTKKSKTIGLLVPGIDNPFFATLSGIIINMIAAKGYHTLLADSRETETEEQQALQMFIARKVDGIISVPVATSATYLEQINRDIPVVLIDRHFRKTTLPYVCTDNYMGAKTATEYLLGKGYKRILAIQGVPTSMPNQERLRGFKDALKGQTVQYAAVGDAFSVENGHDQVLSVFAGGKKQYDAIFAFSATILLGAIDALRSLGLKVGEDVGIISYDNNGFLDFLDPAVTRVEQPLREASELAVDTLFSIMEARREGRPDPDLLQRLIPPTLVVRSSC